MKADNSAKLRSDRVWLIADMCSIDDFAALTQRTTNPADYPFASEVQKNVLIYDGASVRAAAGDPASRKALLAEWVEAMTDGPGVVVFRGAFEDVAPVEAATKAFNAIIAEERAAGAGGGDHLPSPAPTTGYGTRWRSSACAIPRPLPPTTAMTLWR